MTSDKKAASNSSIDVLLEEARRFEPAPGFRSQANVKDPSVYERANQDFESYWADWARQLDWVKPWNQVLEWKPPHAKWFIGGKINACFNCVDRHLLAEAKVNRRNKTAILWEGEPGDTKVLTYEELHQEVQKQANVLKKLGVKKGDRVSLYLPMIPELVIACLACARIGAIHSVVFGGFSAESLRDRINDQEAKVLITADYGWRRGKHVLLKKAADEALEQCPSIETVIVVKRDVKGATGQDICSLKEGRDCWWHELMSQAESRCECEKNDAEDILFILYTSGTTGKPKGIVHTTGGYLTGVYATTKWVFDLKEKDIFWCTADVGWVTGHSYIIYGPLANGATVLMYEGSPDWPEKDRFWKLIEKYKVSIFYTAPTAVRAFMKWGAEWTEKADLSSLRLLGTVGEPINPEAWMWYQQHIGKGKCPIVDTWWQTETGCILVSPLPGITTTKPGSASKPFPGIFADVVNENGDSIAVGGGYIAITKPWPAMLRTIYKDDKRYREQYWTKWKKDLYFAGDGVKRDRDGDLWFLGRVDDVMNVAGHRIGTMEIESALVDHPGVAEAAVVSRPHEIKGEAIVAFVTLKEKTKSTEDLIEELKNHVGKKIGPIAKPDDILFTAELPKTRSGKIMRRLLRDISTGKALGDTTTLADPTVVEGLKKKYENVEGT